MKPVILCLDRWVVLAVVCAVGCGGSDSSPTNPSPTAPAATITITSAGVDTRSVQVAPGSRLRFINNDSRDHFMASNPHPEHTDCPEINLGTLRPGQSRETGNLVVTRTCGFHDHDNPGTASLQGSIVIR
jgi:hypothetical protein